MKKLHLWLDEDQEETAQAIYEKLLDFSPIIRLKILEKVKEKLGFFLYKKISDE